MLAIRDFFVNLGKQIDIHTLFRNIGSAGTLAVAIAFGVLYLVVAGLIINLLSRIENIMVKVIALVVGVSVFAFIGYVYVDLFIYTIGALGGL